MGLEVYRLNKQLPSLIYSNADPTKYYDPADLLASRIYACNALGATDSIRALSYRLIDVKLPLQLAHELYQLYIDDPSAYAFPSNFAQHFPGIYIKNSYGSGRVIEISSTIMRMYYHTTTTDSQGKEKITRHQGSYYAVTPEIVLNNNLSYTISDDLRQRIDKGEDIIVAPVGRDIELQFPIKEIIDHYNANSGSLAVVNSLTFDSPPKKSPTTTESSRQKTSSLSCQTKKMTSSSAANSTTTSHHSTHPTTPPTTAIGSPECANTSSRCSRKPTSPPRTTHSH